MNFFLIIAALGALLLIARMALKSRPSMTPKESDTAIKTGLAVLVDVREPAEWTGGVADAAVLLPLSDLRGSRERWKPFLNENRGKRILLYCQSGMRSGIATSLLKAEGFDAVNIGTFSNWRAERLPVRIP